MSLMVWSHSRPLTPDPSPLRGEGNERLSALGADIALADRVTADSTEAARSSAPSNHRARPAQRYPQCAAKQHRVASESQSNWPIWEPIRLGDGMHEVWVFLLPF